MAIFSHLHLLQPGGVTVRKGVHDLPDGDAKGAEPVQDGSGEAPHGGELGGDVEGVQVDASTRNHFDQCHLVWLCQVYSCKENRTVKMAKNNLIKNWVK